MKSFHDMFCGRIDVYFGTVQINIKDYEQIQFDAQAQGRYDALTEAAAKVKSYLGVSWSICEIEEAILALHDNKQKV